MKIVVTGALGHIGSRLIRDLAGAMKNIEFTLIDNMLTQRYPSLFSLPSDAKYRFIEASVMDLNMIELLDNVDVVIHLAAITNAAASFDNREEVERVNYDATVRVADACAVTSSSLIHLSSTSVYGTQNEVVDEFCTEDELKPQSPYAETKLKEENYLKNKALKSNLQYVVCRFGTICGISPGMRFHTAVNKFCWQAVMGVPITVWRTAMHQKRPYLTLEEAVEAVKFIIENDIFDGNVYNILTDNYTVNQIVENIKKYIPDLSIEYVDTEIMNQLSYEVLDKRFRDHGFSYRGSVQESIADTIQLLVGANSSHGG